MDILEFIKNYYPIKNKIEMMRMDPYKRIADADDLPYDIIGPDSSGRITKLVEVEPDRYVSVMELLGYEKEELEASGDLALLNVFEIYMDQIDMEDINLVDIMASVKQHKKKLMADKEKLDVLHL